ncbi:hypothetical protein CPC735_033980 [Coccidioides posadasii C735 delta SOWgp]|uniref:Mid2 domain-containing protein n=1 Tax=Coccidioides posadasii (strain C735) TaxID=222929 RepID=C5P5S2_COCP7|nr:hypothetical protein CPC735_033980 [Coccidioides posadasii C735 delta SOWgp]EER28062.1 hypothetical protein CPC735_033980 [Coccidioides posadasii C735 delta SOWgp]|eukprot:XP_003070207.1 hypothetical protein CPC735_033980 [Coccidioides posadasii C735 delta SOWgp]
MRRATHRSTALSVVALLAATPLPTYASPFPTQSPSHDILIHRDCANPCGFYGQVCCQQSEECYTNSDGQAACRSASKGEWEYFTTIYTRTDLVVVTSTGSRAASPTSPGDTQCRISLGETPCGDTCCTAAETCNAKGVCVEGGSSPFPSASPPTRPTSDATVTATKAPTTTVGFIPAISTDGSTLIGGITHGSGGLSGGAIAGIVIGSLAGAFVLLLLCLCFCVGSIASRIRGVFGGGRPHPPSTVYSSSYMYSASESGGGHGGWHGGQPPSEHGKSGWAKWLSIGFLAGAIALCLGLRRQRAERSEKSYYSYYTASSSESSSSSPSSGRPPRSGHHPPRSHRGYPSDRGSRSHGSH